MFYSEFKDGRTNGDNTRKNSEDEVEIDVEDDSGDGDKVNQAMDTLFKERGFIIYDGIPDRVPLEEFSLKGCSIMSSSERTLNLANGQLKTCELQFESHKQMVAWKEAIESCVKVIEMVSVMRSSEEARGAEDESPQPFMSADEEVKEPENANAQADMQE